MSSLVSIRSLRAIIAVALVLLVFGAHGAAHAQHDLSALPQVRIPILTYHSIFPDRPGRTQEQRAYGVTPEQLEAQLKFLADGGYTAITMQEVEEAIRSGTTSKKVVALTFDDGLWNQYFYGLPLLKKYGMRATFYIYPNAIERNPVFMDWTQIQELASSSMSIGSHSFTHPYLSRLPAAEREREIRKSKVVLEQHLKQPVTLFATPFGETSTDLERQLQEAGYTSGRSLGGRAFATRVDLFHLKAFLGTGDFERFRWVVGSAP